MSTYENISKHWKEPEKPSIMIRFQSKHRQFEEKTPRARVSRFMDTMYMEWDDYADFERKYGSDNNPKAYLQRSTLWNAFNNYGVLLKNGLIDPEMVYDAAGGILIMSWEKWRLIVEEQRIRYTGPNYLEHWEHLAGVMRSIQERRGIKWAPAETGIKFVE